MCESLIWGAVSRGTSTDQGSRGPSAVVRPRMEMVRLGCVKHTGIIAFALFPIVILYLLTFLEIWYGQF